MFRIVCDPSSGSVERAWLKLLVVFFVCVVGVWQHNFEPAVCVPGTTKFVSWARWIQFIPSRLLL